MYFNLDNTGTSPFDAHESSMPNDATRMDKCHAAGASRTDASGLQLYPSKVVRQSRQENCWTMCWPPAMVGLS